MTGDDFEEEPTLPQPAAPRGGRAKRDSLSAAVRGALKRLIPSLTALLMAVLLFWTTKIQATAEDAQDTAETASAKGEKIERVAKTVKVENQAAYDVTTDKAVSMADDMAKLVDRVNALEAELERLRARAGKPRRRRAPITLSPKTIAPPPPTPAAAANEMKE